MKPVDWNQHLSSKNPWTQRLLGLEVFSKTRDLNQIEREYNQDKYGSLCQFDFADIEAYKQQEFRQVNLTWESNVVISLGESVFETQLGFARSLYQTQVMETIRKYRPARICELGCGYGYNLSYLKDIAEVYGGEYSSNAVKLSQRLGIDVELFNYYQSADYQLIRDKSLIFTSHSIEQLPSAKSFIEHLAQHRNRVTAVVHFEPTVLATRTSLVGILRNRYLEINDYNRDLVNLLQHRSDIEILEFTPDLIGLNPLNSTCLIIWRFR